MVTPQQKYRVVSTILKTFLIEKVKERIFKKKDKSYAKIIARNYEFHKKEKIYFIHPKGYKIMNKQNLETKLKSLPVEDIITIM